MGEYEIYNEWDFIGVGYEIIVPEPTEYRVRVEKWGSPIYDENVTIPWPTENPLIDIYI